MGSVIVQEGGNGGSPGDLSWIGHMIEYINSIIEAKSRSIHQNSRIGRFECKYRKRKRGGSVKLSSEGDGGATADGANLLLPTNLNLAKYLNF